MTNTYVLPDSMLSFKHLEQTWTCWKAYFYVNFLKVTQIYDYPQNYMEIAKMDFLQNSTELCLCLLVNMMLPI